MILRSLSLWLLSSVEVSKGQYSIFIVETQNFASQQYILLLSFPDND